MSSLLTNSAAMTALQTLSGTNKQMDTTQNRISSRLPCVRCPPTTPPIGRLQPPCARTTRRSAPFQDALGLGRRDRGRDVYRPQFDSRCRLRDQGQGHCRRAARRPIAARSRARLTNCRTSCKNIAASAVFNGEKTGCNSTPPMRAPPPIARFVSSFTRTATGAVSLETNDRRDHGDAADRYQCRQCRYPR